MALSAPEVVRVAPLETGGEEIEIKGVDAILENTRRLNADVEYLSVQVLGPLLLDNRFAVRFAFDQLDVRTGTRSQTTKLSLCTVQAGHITREEVFCYSLPHS